MVCIDMNKIHLLRILVCTVNSKNFREAATRLSVSPQVVSRAISELEELTNQTLFYRNTRKVKVTSFGAELSIEAERLLGQVDEFFRLNIANDYNAGNRAIKITGPSVLGRKHLIRALQDLLKENPDISIDLRLSDQVLDVVDEKIDVGIRFGMFRDQRFVARLVGSIKFYTVAAPELISKFAAPSSIDDLFLFPTSGLINSETGKIWPWYFKDGKTFVPSSPTILTDDAELELEATLSGLVFSQIPDYMAEQYIVSGELISVLGELTADSWGVYVYRTQKNPVSSKVRLIFDHLSDYMRNSKLC